MREGGSFEGCGGVTVDASKEKPPHLEVAHSAGCTVQGTVVCLDDQQEAGAQQQQWHCSWFFRKAQATKEIFKQYAGMWVAMNIVLSAFLYFFDFVTNINTLRTYYVLQITCPKPGGDTRDECGRMGYTSFVSVFYVSLSLMILAHVSNSLIFWITLPADDHPLRWAYFSPLIHLYRFFKVLWQACSCRGLKEYFKYSLEEMNSLYNVLAASLETTSQLILQFHVIMELGVTYSDPVEVFEPTPVPRNLIVSLVASVLSGIYNGSIAVLFLVRKRGLIFPWTVLILVTAGIHTLAAMAGKAVVVAGLADAEDLHLHFGALIGYSVVAGLVNIVFFVFMVRNSEKGSTKPNKWRYAVVHAVAVAHVSLFIGPMYVIVKLFDEPCVYLVWATILHIFTELVGLAVLLLYGHLVSFGDSGLAPCGRDFHGGLMNAYLTCKVYLGVLCTSLLLLFLSTVIFVVAYKRGRRSNAQRPSMDPPAKTANNEEHEPSNMDPPAITANNEEHQDTPLFS